MKKKYNGKINRNKSRTLPAKVNKKKQTIIKRKTLMERYSEDKT